MVSVEDDECGEGDEWEEVSFGCHHWFRKISCVCNIACRLGFLR